VPVHRPQALHLAVHIGPELVVADGRAGGKHGENRNEPVRRTLL
jgi:hypothetical protein